MVLLNVVTEMERRYERLAQVRARALPEANRAFRKRGEPELPYLLVVIDESADLMMVSPQDVEDAMIRLAQKSWGRRHPSRARHPAAVGGRDHRHDQGERPLADRVRGPAADRFARDPRLERRREPAATRLQAARERRAFSASRAPS